MTDPTLDELASEEAALQFDTFSLDDAWTIGQALREGALARSGAVAIEIALRDRPLFYTTTPGADTWRTETCLRARRCAAARRWRD